MLVAAARKRQTLAKEMKFESTMRQLEVRRAAAVVAVVVGRVYDGGRASTGGPDDAA
jgi:hypothetical protein